MKTIYANYLSTLVKDMYQKMLCYLVYYTFSIHCRHHQRLKMWRGKPMHAQLAFQCEDGHSLHQNVVKLFYCCSKRTWFLKCFFCCWNHSCIFPKFERIVFCLWLHLNGILKIKDYVDYCFSYLLYC